MVVRVGLAEVPDADVSQASLTVEVNGTACRAVEDLTPQITDTDNPLTGQLARVVPRVAQFEASPASVRRGYNNVLIALSQGKARKIVWLEIYIRP